MDRILVIRFSAMGDVLLATPVLRQLKENFPQAQIHFVVKQDFAEFIAACPDLDNIIVWQKNESLWALRQKIAAQSRKWDLILDLQSNLRSRILSWLVRAQPPPLP
ncbi:MAG: glycosyltransferase family 9 protein [Turneriella sp.]|nr:glycosyltransferase family 9 protein [Turneriella sp.]